MAIEDLLKNVKGKVSAGLLGLSLALSPVYAGCGEEERRGGLGSYSGSGGGSNREWTCESGVRMVFDLCHDCNSPNPKYDYCEGSPKEGKKENKIADEIDDCHREALKHPPHILQGFFSCLYDYCKQFNRDFDDGRGVGIAVKSCESRYDNWDY